MKKYLNQKGFYVNVFNAYNKAVSIPETSGLSLNYYYYIQNANLIL
jgi:hypothetical protein